MDYQMDTSTIKTGQQAVNQAAASKKSQTIGKQTTDRGTLITKSNNEFDKNSFLKIMTAELSNMDPSTSQDNTQYVTQMAQMTTLEQMNNLNNTMTTYSYQGLLGKGVTVDVADLNGEPYTGIVRGVSKQNNEWYLSIDVKENGKIVSKVVDASTLKSVLGTSDTENSNMLVNSNFMAASNLASNTDNKVVILNTDSTGTKTIVKGTVKSAFIDNGTVKVRVAAFDSDGNESAGTTDYPYSYIVKAGNLTDADMNVTVDDYVTSATSTTNSNSDPNSSSYDKSSAEAALANSKTDVAVSTQDALSSDTINNQLKKLQEILNS